MQSYTCYEVYTKRGQAMNKLLKKIFSKKLTFSLLTIFININGAQLAGPEKLAAIIEWQMTPPYNNPLHISLFNFLGWQNIGMLDTALPPALNNIQRVTASAQGLDILLPIAITKDSLSTIAQQSSLSAALRRLFTQNPPTPDNPWYIVLTIKPDDKLYFLRQNILARLPFEAIQSKYTKITPFEKLVETQCDWKPHITLGRIVHINNLTLFEQEFRKAINIATAETPFVIDASMISISTRTTGKKGKLLKIELLQNNQPILYRTFRTIKNAFWGTPGVPSLKIN